MVRRILLLSALLVLVPLPAWAEIAESSRTASLLNGRYWNTLDEAAKLYFLAGVMDGTNAASYATYYAVQGLSGVDNSDSFWKGATCNTCTVGDLATELNLFYSEPSTRGIPIPFALTVCIARFKGARKSEIDDRMTRLRKLFNP